VDAFELEVKGLKVWNEREKAWVAVALIGGGVFESGCADLESWNPLTQADRRQFA
jgi:hypothetical protein